MYNTTERIPIVFVSDDTYAMPTGVAITSLRMNVVKQDNTRYEIFVISLGISEENKKRIRSLETEDFQVSIIEYQFNEIQKSVSSNNGSHVSTTAIVKFDLANIFPQYDKILYLDSDILVLKSVLDLWHTNLEGYYVAAVKDGMSIKKEFQQHAESLGVGANQYFNTGVLLLNLKKIREDGLPEKLLDYRIHGKNYYMDQDAFNAMFRGKVCYVSPYYNLFNAWYRSEEWIRNMSQFYEVDFDLRQGRVFLDAVILHFGDYPKPWNIDKGQLSGLFYSYYNLSPFGDKKDLRIKSKLYLSFPIQYKRFKTKLRMTVYKILNKIGLIWLIKKIRGKK